MLLQVSTPTTEQETPRQRLNRLRRERLNQLREQAATGVSQGVSPAPTGEAPPAPAPAPAPTPERLEALRQQLTPEVSAGRRPASAQPTLEEEPARARVGGLVGGALAARDIAKGLAGGAARLPGQVLRSVATIGALSGPSRGFGVAGDPARTVVGEIERLPEEPTFQAGERLIERAEEALPVPETFAGQVGAGIASGGAFAASSVLGPGAPLLLGLGLEADALREEAKQMGASSQTQARAGGLGAVLGTTEALPIFGLIGRLNRLSGGTAGPMLRRVVVSAFIQSGEEGVQEALQRLGENAVAMKLFDETRTLSDGIAEAGGVGAVVGALFGGVGAGAVSARSRSRTDEALAAGGFEALRQQEVQDDSGRSLEAGAGVAEVSRGEGQAEVGGLREATETGGVSQVEVAPEVVEEVGGARPVEAEELAETLPDLARRFSEADTATEREAIAAQIQQLAEFQEAQARFDELIAEPSPTAEQTAELAEVTQTIRGGRPLATQEEPDAQRQTQATEEADLAQDQPPVEPQDIPQAEAPEEVALPFTTADLRHNVRQKKGGEPGQVEITTADGKPITPSSARYVDVAAEYLTSNAAAFDRQRITPETHPGISSEPELFDAVASESESPFEIIDTISQVRALRASEQNDPVAAEIDALGPFSTSSFDRFGDPNLRKDDNFGFLPLLRSDGQAIDVAAEQVTSATGVETTPDDIVRRIVERAGSLTSDPQEQALAARFEDVTGLRLTPKLLERLSAEAPTAATAPDAPGAPAAGAPVPGLVLPTEIRATREAIERTNDLLGIEQLPPATRQRWGEAMEMAQREGKVSGAEAIAQGVLARNDRILTDVERMGLLLRKAQTEQDLTLSMAAAAQLAEAGDAEGHANALRDYDAAIERLKMLDTALVRSGTLAARALASTRAGIGRDAYSRGQIEIRGIANKGKRLTTTEKKVLRNLAQQIEEQTARIAELESAKDSKIEQRARELAQSQLARMRRTRKGISGVRERRQSIKERIAELGLQVTVGLNPEQAFQIGRLIATYVEEGTLQLPQIIARTRSELPTLEDRDVVDVLAGRFAEKKNRSDAQESLSELKKQSRLVAKIEDEIGVLEGEPKAEAAERVEPSATVASLRVTLNELTEALMREERDADRLAAILERLDLVREAFARGEARIKKDRPPETADIQEAQQALADARRIADIETGIRDLEQQLDTGEFKVPTERARRETTDEVAAARRRLGALRSRADKITRALRPLTGAEKALGALELPRNLLASGDIGALGRQGIFHTLNPLNAKKTARAGSAMLQALTEKGANRVQQALVESPNHARRVRAGLAIKDLEDVRFRDRETVVRNNLIERAVLRRELKGESSRVLSGLAAYMRSSEQNMVVGLNVLRAELFDDFAARNPSATDEDLAVWANYVNVTTGHGASFGQAGDVLNRFFFSPRLLTSRLQTPWTVARTMVRNRAFAKAVGKDVGGLLVTSGAVMGLAALAGADLEFDPEDSDFLKIQVGNQRFDFLGGYGQMIRLSLREGLQVRGVRDRLGLPPPSAFGSSDAYGLFGTYLKYKLAPGITAAFTLASGTDPIGQEAGVGEQALRTVTPIVLQEAYEGFQGGGMMNALAAFGLSQIGVGVATFDNPFKDQKIENTLKRADYVPQMTYPEDASQEEKDALKKRFREVMAAEIEQNLDLLNSLEPEEAKRLLLQMARPVRREVKIEAQ